jgi:hypothetical protein
MYATIRHRERGTASADELAREGWALGALLGAAPGFVACLLLATPDGCAAIGIFEDAASLAAADTLVAGWSPAGCAAPWAGVLGQITGEVVAQKGL